MGVLSALGRFVGGEAKDSASCGCRPGTEKRVGKRTEYPRDAEDACGCGCGCADSAPAKRYLAMVEDDLPRFHADGTIDDGADQE